MNSFKIETGNIVQRKKQNPHKIAYPKNSTLGEEQATLHHFTSSLASTLNYLIKSDCQNLTF